MPPNQQCRITLRYDNRCDQRRYNLPSAASNEIAVILPGDGESLEAERDIILYRKAGEPLQRIGDLHPLYQSLHYVLLFPTGQLGWNPHIPFHNGAEVVEEQNEEPDADGNRWPSAYKHVTQSQYFRYRLHIHMNETNHLFLAGKLFQEWIVDSWASTEQSRLLWITLNQKTLRVENLRGLMDAFAANPLADGADIGQRIILPSSFIGSTRNMIQNCQDALAINHHFGGADLFITVTANPKWPEITEALLHGQKAHDRPDLIARVFHAKVKAIIQDIMANGILGKTVARVHTIEFQKRGLPHMHIIIFLHPDSKLRTPEDVYSVISAEFPEDDPELLELVKHFMVHAPCTGNASAACVKEPSKGCSKSFPKPYHD